MQKNSSEIFDRPGSEYAFANIIELYPKSTFYCWTLESKNFQSRSVVRNWNKNELTGYSHAKWIESSQTSKNREKKMVECLSLKSS